MSWTWRPYSENDNAGKSTSVSVNFIGATSVGDLLVAWVECNGAITDGSAPPGWIQEILDNNTNISQAIYWKVSDGTETGFSVSVGPHQQPWSVAYAEFQGWNDDGSGVVVPAHITRDIADSVNSGSFVATQGPNSTDVGFNLTAYAAELPVSSWGLNGGGLPINLPTNWSPLSHNTAQVAAQILTAYYNDSANDNAPLGFDPFAIDTGFTGGGGYQSGNLLTFVDPAGVKNPIGLQIAPFFKGPPVLRKRYQPVKLGGPQLSNATVYNARLWIFGNEAGSGGVTASSFEFTVNSGSGVNDFSSVTNPVRSGNYSLSVNVAGLTDVSFAAKSNYSVGKLFSQAYMQTVSLPSANTTIIQHVASATGILTLLLNTNGTLTLKQGSSSGATIGTTTTVLSTNTFYRFDTRSEIDPTNGVVEFKLYDNNDNLLETITGTSQNTGSAKLTGVIYGSRAANIGTIWDDIVEDSIAYPGGSKVIARQPITGTPTYNEWTKTGADPYWADTPFDTVNFATSLASNGATNRQTKFIHDFLTTQAGHGTEVIGVNDQINIAAIVYVAQGNSSITLPNGKFRRRYSGVDVDDPLAANNFGGFPSTLAFFFSNPWIPTLSLLGSMEAGGVVTSSNSHSIIIEDLWVMVEYKPATVAVTTLQTITGVSRIAVTTLQIITGLARITATTLKTVTGLSRITVITLQTITGISRITATSLKTIQAKANISGTTLRTIVGVARITVATLRTVSGVARITITTLKTLTGLSRITAVTLRTITGLARVTSTTLRTITGVSRVTVTTLRTISGLSRVTVTTARAINGLARITATTLKTITGVSRIQVVVNKTISGLSRITATATKTITGLSRITATTTRTITGRARITVTTLKTITGLASIVQTATRTITGVSRITATATKTISGKADILATILKTITGVSRIQVVVNKTITGLARITVTTTKTISGLARITAITFRTITGLSRITATTTKTIAGLSRIQQTVLAGAGFSLNFGNTSNGAANTIVSATTPSSFNNLSAFTVEAYVTLSAIPSVLTRIFDVAQANSGFNLEVNSLGKPAGVVGNGTTTVSATNGTALTLNKKTHIAISYDGTTIRVFIGGSLGTGSAAQSGNTATADVQISIGNNKALTRVFPGSIDELRISNIARYTSSFTPPTTRLTTDSNTLELFHFDEGTGTSTTGVNGLVGTLSGSPLPAWVNGMTEITGLARITAQTTRIVLGLARIQTLITKTITGLARINQIVNKTITGLARITVSTSRTISGKADILLSVSRTIAGLARVTAVVSRTVTGLARITQIVPKTITGLSRIQISVSRTITGLARITKVISQTITGVAKISTLFTQNRLITGLARIQVTLLKTITGLSRIALITTRNITGKARLTLITVQNILGQARIQVTTTRQITGTASIAFSKQIQDFPITVTSNDRMRPYVVARG